MKALISEVERTRSVRDAARTVFDARYGALKDDIEERGIAGRIIDETLDQAGAMVDEALAVAHEHPGAIGGTLAALVLWFLRNPLMAWIESRLGQLPQLLKEQDGEQD